MSRAWRRGAIVSGLDGPALPRRCNGPALPPLRRESAQRPGRPGRRRSRGPRARFSFETFAAREVRHGRCDLPHGLAPRCMVRSLHVCLRHERGAGAVLPAAASVGRTHLRRGQQNENTPHRNLPCCKHESPTCPGVRFVVMRGDVSARHSVRSEHSGSFWTLTCMRDARGRQVPVGHRGYPRGRAQTGTHVFRTVLPSRAARACRAPPRAHATSRAGADARRE